MLKIDRVVNAIEEVVKFADQLNMDVNNENVNEFLDSHSQELTIYELLEIHEQNIAEERDTLDPDERKSIKIEKLIEGLSSIKNGMQILECIDPNEE